MINQPLTDCHIHILALNSPETKHYGNILRKNFYRSISFGIIGAYHKISLSDKNFNSKYITILDQEIKNSVSVKKGIVFGMDGVYDNKGKFDHEKTSLYISNDYVFDSIKGKKNLKFGASINPNRKDSISELHRCIEKKAALIKVLPNVQGFAPDNKKFKSFYRIMADNKIPLLSHTGFEFALKSIDQTYGHPEKLKLALDEGVNVIAAHGCSTGLVFLEVYKKHILELIKAYPNFYIDMSALSVFTRIGILPFLRKHEEVRKRMIFGTDYPLPIHFYPFYPILGKNKIKEIKKIQNYFDRYAAIMLACGFLNNKPPLKFK